jgi:hypothetical protein
MMTAVFPAAAAQAAGNAWSGGIADDAASHGADRSEHDRARADAQRAVKQPVFAMSRSDAEGQAQNDSDDKRYSGHCLEFPTAALSNPNASERA